MRIENFIPLPYTSKSGYFVFMNPWDILNCGFVLFFLKYIEEKRPGSPVFVAAVQICYNIGM